MTHDDELFQRFRRDGDVAALGELFDRTAPALLRVAMHLALDPAAAEDLLQSTYLRAIEARDEWDGGRAVLPWLLGILHNRARHARRRDARSPDPERLAVTAAGDPARSAEQAELDAAVDAAIAELPATYRPVLRLHLAYGHAPAEIAHALERPPGTVRSQLARGLERLRLLLPRGFGGAAAIALGGGRGLAAVKADVLLRATLLEPSASAGMSIAGVTLVKTKTMLVATAVAVLGTGVWLSRTPEESLLTAGGAKDVEPARLALEVSPPELSSPLLGDQQPGRVAVTRPKAASTGALRVQCRWEEDDSPAGGVLVSVMERGSFDRGLLQRSALTDTDGWVLLADLPAGTAHLLADRGGATRTEVVAGERSDVELVIPAGVNLRGRVVDEHGSPISAARVWLSVGARDQDYGQYSTSVDPAGRFRLRSVEPERFVSAAAPGHRTAVLQPVGGKIGDAVEVVLVLHGPGVTLEGRVVEAGGKRAVAGARVMVGARREGHFAWNPDLLGDDRPPQTLVTDEQGLFRVHGLEPGGEVPVWARASGWCAWMRPIALREAGTTVCTIELDRGASIAGRVTDGDGQPVGAVITYRHSAWLPQHRDFHDFLGPAWACDAFSSDPAGVYRMDHVPPGTLRLIAQCDGIEDRSEVVAASGQTLTWDPVLKDRVIRGRVVDERGQPLKGMRVTCQPPRGTGGNASATTAADGRFHCRKLAPQPYVIGFHAPGDELGVRAAAKLWGIVPGSDEVLVCVPDAALPSASISGNLLDSDGRPFGVAQVRCSAQGLEWDPSDVVDPTTGRFHIGPLPPGSYRLQTAVDEPSRDSAWSEPIALVAGEQRDVGVLPVPEPGAIAVVVTGPEGDRLQGAEVALEHSTGWSAYLGRAAATRDGVARLVDVAPGSYRIQVSGRGLPNVYAPVRVVSGRESEVEIEVPHSLECRFVLSPPSEAVPMNETFVWLRDGQLHERWSNRWEARSELPLTMQLVPGEYEVTVTSETGRRAFNTFRIELGDPPDREIAIRLP